MQSSPPPAPTTPDVVPSSLDALRRTWQALDRLELKSTAETIEVKVGATIHHCRLMNGDVTNFRTGTWISAGASSVTIREMIYFNADSDYLKKKYKELKSSLERVSFDNPDKIIQAVMVFVRDQFSLTSDYKTQLAEIHRGQSWGIYEGQPIIPLNTFIHIKIGVCRHHGLLLAYLLDSLKDEGLLPPGNIYHHRDTIKLSDGKEGAHVWVMYQEENGKLRWIDSLWNENLSFPEGEDKLIRLYGFDTISRCKARYFRRPAAASAPPPPASGVDAAASSPARVSAPLAPIPRVNVVAPPPAPVPAAFIPVVVLPLARVSVPAPIPRSTVDVVVPPSAPALIPVVLPPARVSVPASMPSRVDVVAPPPAPVPAALIPVVLPPACVSVPAPIPRVNVVAPPPAPPVPAAFIPVVLPPARVSVPAPIPNGVDVVAPPSAHVPPAPIRSRVEAVVREEKTTITKDQFKKIIVKYDSSSCCIFKLFNKYRSVAIRGLRQLEMETKEESIITKQGIIDILNRDSYRGRLFDDPSMIGEPTTSTDSVVIELGKYFAPNPI